MKLNSVEIRTSASKLEGDREAYEAARAVLTEKGIDGIPGFDSLVAPGDTILTFFGYDDDGVAIFAVLPKDLPRYDGWTRVLNPSSDILF